MLSWMLPRKLLSKCDTLSFTTAAFIAYLCHRHAEYRKCLFDHLLNVTLRHWDSSMRELGAHSLGRICSMDLATLGPEGAQRAVSDW